MSEARAIDDDAAHLLIVDDDTRIRTLLKRYLGENGYRVSTAAAAAEARRKLEGLDFDLLVLDVMMPGEDGVSLTRHLRDVRPVPVLLLTAKAEADARIAGLEAGADDYLVKPFEPRELLLRISNILRRADTPKTPAIEQVVFGPYSFSLARRELKRGATPIRLTEREQDILAMLAEKAGEKRKRALSDKLLFAIVAAFVLLLIIILSIWNAEEPLQLQCYICPWGGTPRTAPSSARFATPDPWTSPSLPSCTNSSPAPACSPQPRTKPASQHVCTRLCPATPPLSPKKKTQSTPPQTKTATPTSATAPKTSNTTTAPATPDGCWPHQAATRRPTPGL